MSGGGLRKPTENLRMAGHLGAKVLSKPFSNTELIAAVNGMLPDAATPAT
jgi:DNA-binding response OmpR family regulator